MATYDNGWRPTSINNLLDVQNIADFFPSSQASLFVYSCRVSSPEQVFVCLIYVLAARRFFISLNYKFYTKSRQLINVKLTWRILGPLKTFMTFVFRLSSRWFLSFVGKNANDFCCCVNAIQFKSPKWKLCDSKHARISNVSMICVVSPSGWEFDALDCSYIFISSF